MQLSLWSFLVLPVSGYVTGQIFKFMLGIREPSEYGALVVHIVTTSLFIIIFSDMLSDTSHVKTKNERVLFLSITYLFVLGVNLGLIKGLI